MRHNMNHRKLNRSTNQRKALLTGLAINLVERERITTTVPKAKEGKTKNPLIAYQQIYKALGNKEATKKIIGVLAPRCKDRLGGYLRILKAGFRYGDQAPLAIIEFVDQSPIQVSI